MSSWKVVIVIVVLASAMVGSPAAGQPDAQFGRANDEFAKGQFEAAIRDYNSLVQARQWSAPLFYNLGNAYFRAGDFGQAILNYERALALEPHHPETVANLALVREEARALELQHGWFSAVFKHIGTTQFTVVAAIAFWAGAAASILLLFNVRRSRVTMAIAVLGFSLTILCATIVFNVESFRRPLAIVTKPEVQARLATADTASSVLQLPPGSQVQILSRRGDWVYTQLPNDLRGWIPANSVELVRL